MKKFLFGLTFGLLLFGCNENCNELVNYNGSDYNLKLQICSNNSHVDRLSSYEPNRIILKNEIFKVCLATLIAKNTSLIKFESSAKGDLMINATYENLRQNSNERDTKSAFLLELKKAMKFSLIEEYPKEMYQLTVKNNNLLQNHLSTSINDSSSIYSGPDIFKAYNSSMPSIADGLTNVYKGKAMFVVDSSDIKRYTFKIENIPFDKLKMYLENKIGLSFVTIDKIKGAKSTTKVVFND